MKLKKSGDDFPSNIQSKEINFKLSTTKPNTTTTTQTNDNPLRNSQQQQHLKKRKRDKNNSKKSTKQKNFLFFSKFIALFTSSPNTTTTTTASTSSTDTGKNNNNLKEEKLQQIKEEEFSLQQIKEEEEKVKKQREKEKKRKAIIQIHYSVSAAIEAHNNNRKVHLTIEITQQQQKEEESLDYQFQNISTPSIAAAESKNKEETNKQESGSSTYPSPLVQDLKIEDYYNLTTTQVPNSQFLHRLDSRMVGILSESDIDKCKDVIPKDQTFITGFSLLLLTHSTSTTTPSQNITTGTSPSTSLGNLANALSNNANIISQTNNNNNNNNGGGEVTKKIRTYSTSPVALLLSDKSAFIVLYDTRTQSIQQIETCDLIEIRDIQTGYIHTPSVDSDESVFMSNSKKSGQFSMRILKIYGGSWTLMPYSPTDSPDILKERVLSVAIIIRSLIQNSKLSHTIEAKLENSEKFHVPVAYYQAKSETIVEGEIYFNLKKFSFIQTKNDMKFKNIINYKREDYSFSIELLTIYECAQSNSTIIDGYSQLAIQSQGKSSNQSYILFLPKLEIDQITKNIIRLVTESQDIVDQIVLDGDDNSNITTTSNVSDEIYNEEEDILDIKQQQQQQQQEQKTYPTKVIVPTTGIKKTKDNKKSQTNIKDTDFYLINDSDDEEDYNSSEVPYKNNFVGESSLLTEEDQKWLQSHFPMRHKAEEFELVYSTSKHGISIRTFFSRLAGRSPCVLVIKDDKHNIFGAYTSDPWNPDSNVHYGSGETFLFKLSSEQKGGRKKFSWTRENEFFMLSKDNFLSLGSGKSGAGFGLWIDEDLLYGSSTKCETFNNEILSYSSEFKILEIEVWSSIFSKTQAKKVQNATDFFGTSFSYKPPPRTSVYSNRGGATF